MAERSLGVRETPGSIPGSPKPDSGATVCFVYGHAPSGHSLAAAALKDELAARRPSWRLVEVALAADIHPMLGPFVSRAYLELVQRTPRLWDALYDNKLLAGALDELKPLLSLSHRRKLQGRLDPLGPDLVVCTHALPCATLAVEKKEGRLACPLVGVITDFGVHAYWVSDQVDLYLAPTASARAALIRRGVRPSRIRVSGIPVHRRFRRPPSKAAARRRLGLGIRRPTIVLQGGSRGLGATLEHAGALLSRLPGAQVVAACGENRSLLRRLEAGPGRLWPERFKVLPFTAAMADLLAAADLLIGKAGGLTLSEALAVGVPILIVSPLPGQEERNAAALVSAGAALRVRDPRRLPGIVGSLLRSPRRLSALGRRAAALGRPDSAAAACRALLSLVKASPI